MAKYVGSSCWPPVYPTTQFTTPVIERKCCSGSQNHPQAHTSTSFAVDSVGSRPIRGQAMAGRVMVLSAIVANFGKPQTHWSAVSRTDSLDICPYDWRIARHMLAPRDSRLCPSLFPKERATLVTCHLVAHLIKLF
jgi:hypothetical protein